MASGQSKESMNLEVDQKKLSNVKNRERKEILKKEKKEILGPCGMLSKHFTFLLSGHWREISVVK